MVSSKTKQEWMRSEEAGAEWLNLAPDHPDSPLMAHLSPRITGSPPGWLLPSFLTYFGHCFPLEPSLPLKRIAPLTFWRPQARLPPFTVPMRRGLGCLRVLLSQKFSLSLIFYIQNISGTLDLHLISTDAWKTKCPGLTRRGRKEDMLQA